MCDDELRGKKLKALIPPSSGARYWSADYAERNQAVANQRVTGDNTRWKSITGYHRRSIAATARYRVKQLFGGHLSLRDYDGQVAEALAMICALNKMTFALGRGVWRTDCLAEPPRCAIDWRRCCADYRARTWIDGARWAEASDLLVEQRGV